MTTVIFSWLFSLLFPWVFLLALGLSFGTRGYAKAEEKRFSFLTMFPQELFDGKDSSRVGARLFIYGYAFLDAFIGCFPLVVGFLPQSFLPFAVLFLVFGVVKNASLIVLVRAPAYEFKPHLLAFVVYAGFSVLSMTMAAILFVNLRIYSQTLAVVFTVLAGLLGIGELFVIVNPKLSQWTKLRASVDAEGNVDTSRPRPFVLAFSEWILFALSTLGTLVGILGFTLLALSAI